MSREIKQVGFNLPSIFLVCFCVLPCKFVLHKELRCGLNHTVLLCWDEALHCIVSLLVCVAKWKIKCWKCFLRHFRHCKTPKPSPHRCFAPGPCLGAYSAPQTSQLLYHWLCKQISSLCSLFSLTLLGRKSACMDLFNVHSHVCCKIYYFMSFIDSEISYI